MKLNEITDRLAGLQQLRINETPEEYAQRYWNDLPRMPFKELPLSLQKEARLRHTPETVEMFVRTLYAREDFARVLSTMTEEEREKHGLIHVDATTFSEVTEGIPEEGLQKIFLRTRNTAIYTVEYEIEQGQQGEQIYRPVPCLYGNFTKSAFESAVDEFRKKEREKLQKKLSQQEAKEERQKAIKAREQAKKQGLPLPPMPRQAQKPREDIVSAGYYQYVISDTKYQHALTPQYNKNAYITLMQPDFFKQLDFKDGTITYNKEIQGIVQQYTKGRYTDIQDLDFPLLIQIYTAAVKANLSHDAYTITVSMPQFFREMGIEVSKGNAPDIIAKLHSFENCVGIMPGTETISKLFSIIQWDMKKQTITFAVPYIMKLSEVLAEKNHIEKATKSGEPIHYLQPFHNVLIHSSIAKERNKAAVELVYLITTGLLRRGYKPDIQTYRKNGARTKYPERVTYSISFRSLINDAPLLRGRLASYDNASDKNKALRRSFEKAYQLIDTKTDAAEWFIDFQYNKIIPTMTTLDDEITITHNGKNGDYKPKKYEVS